jgi:hypothetical protein
MSISSSQSELFILKEDEWFNWGEGMRQEPRGVWHNNGVGRVEISATAFLIRETRRDCFCTLPIKHLIPVVWTSSAAEADMDPAEDTPATKIWMP